MPKCLRFLLLIFALTRHVAGQQFSPDQDAYLQEYYLGNNYGINGEFITTNTIPPNRIIGGVLSGSTLFGGVIYGTYDDLRFTTQPVFEGDPRLTDARTPLAHTHSGYGSGSLNLFAAPVSNTTHSPLLSNTNASGLILTNGNNILLSHEIDGNSNSTVKIEATSAIAGPRGADGFGDIHYYRDWVGGVNITSTPALVKFGTDTYITTNTGVSSTAPDVDATRWTPWLVSGADGVDGVSIALYGLVARGPWSSGMDLASNDFFYTDSGTYLPIVAITNAPSPDIGLGITNYHVLARSGAAGASGYNLGSFFYAGPWADATAYPTGVFVTVDFGTSFGLYYPTSGIPYLGAYPFPPQEPWVEIVEILDGSPGSPGSNGADGIGNLIYDFEWSSIKVYQSNTLVKVVRDDGRSDIYRAKVTTGNGPPNLAPTYWELWLESGYDAAQIGYDFFDGYEGTRIYSNALVREGGAVYYTDNGGTPFQGISPPGATWGLFVRDGTSLASNMNWRGYWNASDTYTNGDWVTYDGSTYAVTGSVPTTASPGGSNWLVVTSIGATGPQGPPGADGAVTIVSNITVVLTQELQVVTNIFNEYNTNTVVNYTNDVTFYYFTNNEWAITAFGVTNVNPNGWTLQAGTNWAHTVDVNRISYLSVNTNGGGNGAGTLTNAVSTNSWLTATVLGPDVIIGASLTPLFTIDLSAFTGVVNLVSSPGVYVPDLPLVPGSSNAINYQEMQDYVSAHAVSLSNAYSVFEIDMSGGLMPISVITALDPLWDMDAQSNFMPVAASE